MAGLVASQTSAQRYTKSLVYIEDKGQAPNGIRVTTIVCLPLTTNWQAWYAHTALLGLAILLALALYGFVTNLRGRRLWANE